MGKGVVWPVAGSDTLFQQKPLELSVATSGHARWYCRRRDLEAVALLMGLEFVLEAAPVAEEEPGFRVAGRCGIAEYSIHDELRASHRLAA